MSKPKADKFNVNNDLHPLLRSLSEFKQDPKNAKKHGERDIVAIASSLARFGQQKPIVVREDGVIIAGHGTYQAATRMGWTHLAAVRFDKDAPAEQLGYAIADNRTSELSTWDDVILAEALTQLAEANDGVLLDVGFTDDEFMKLQAKVEAEARASADAGAAAGTGAAPPPPAGTGGVPTPPGDAQPSNVRMVQLFLTDATHPEFVEWVKTLAAEFKTTNVTDTVFEAVKRYHAGSRPKE